MDSGGRKVKEPPPFVRTAPAAPEWLDDEARAEWERVVPEMDRLKMLKGSSFSSLVAYCECWSRYLGASRELRAHVEETGRMTSVGKGWAGRGRSRGRSSSRATATVRPVTSPGTLRA